MAYVYILSIIANAQTMPLLEISYLHSVLACKLEGSLKTIYIHQN